MIKLNKEISLGTLIENQFGDQYLFSVNRNNFEKIDYQTLFNNDFGSTFEQQDSLYIITGTDSGLMVKQLLKTPPKRGSAYLFIEFAEIIELTKSQYPELEEENEDYRRIKVTTEDKWLEEAGKLGLETYCYLNKVKQIKSFACQYYYLNDYIALKNTIEDQVNHQIWNYQTQIGNRIFEQRQIENLAENHTPAILLKDKFKGKSALILAGGPSLDNYIDWIEEHQQHYLVIAVSRIARRLLQTNIKPDIFVSVDPHPSNFNVSKEVFNFEKDSLLVNQNHVSPMLLGNWLGVSLYFDDVFPWKTKLNVENIKGVGPTVTNTAISLAINMGVKQQILFGVDLCYSPEGYTHAKGSQEHDAGPDVNSIGYSVETNSGEKAETNAAYYEAITSIEYLAELAKIAGGELINPSPDSAQMKGVKYLPLTELSLEREVVNISSFLQEQFKQQEQSDYKVKHYQNVLKELQKAQFKIDKVAELADKGLEYNKKFFAGDDPSKNFKFKIKMDKLEKQLNEKDLTGFTELSKKMGIKEFLYFLNPDSDREWTNEEIKQSGDTYYNSLKNGAKELNRHIFTAINRTEIRLLEHNALVDDEELIKRQLMSFEISYLLDRKIINKENEIIINYKKQTLEQNILNKNILKKFIKNKHEIINDCKALQLQFEKEDVILGKTHSQRIKAILYFLLMLHIQEDYHSRRLLIISQKNPMSLLLPLSTSLLESSPYKYIESQKNIINDLQFDGQKGVSFSIQKQLENITENYASASLLNNCFKGKSALIINSKSLSNENITWIENNQNSFIIIVETHIYKTLIQTNINIDIFIALDTDELSALNSKEIFTIQKKTLLIHKNSISSRLLGNWLGLNCYLGALFPWKTKLNKNNFPTSASNSNNTDKISTIFSLVEHMGFEHCILTEQQSGISKKSFKFSIEQLISGKTNYSYENKFKSLDAISIIPFIEKQISVTNKYNNKVEHYQLVLEELKIAQDSLEKIYEKILSALNILDKENTLKVSLVSKLKDIENEFNNSKFIALSKNFGIYELLNIENKHKKDINDWILYFKGLGPGITILSRHVFSSINKVEVRLLENGKLHIDKNLINRHLLSFNKSSLLDNHMSKDIVKNRINKVLKAYNSSELSLGKDKNEREQAIAFFLFIHGITVKHESYSRIKNLEIYNSKLFNISEDIILADKTVKEWKELLENNFKILTRSSDNLSKLEGIEAKLYNFFILKDKQAIEKLIAGLVLLKKEPESQALIHLAKAYLYELKNDIDMAIVEYGYANTSKTIEGALKRLSFISLDKGQVEQAHNILKMLSEISPEYLPQLAELYLITKNYKDALDAYSHYLNHNPTDISILLKVASIYELQNIHDGAEFIYKKIIGLDPKNQKAKSSLIKLEPVKETV